MLTSFTPQAFPFICFSPVNTSSCLHLIPYFIKSCFPRDNYAPPICPKQFSVGGKNRKIALAHLLDSTLLLNIYPLVMVSSLYVVKSFKTQCFLPLLVNRPMFVIPFRVHNLSVHNVNRIFVCLKNYYKSNVFPLLSCLHVYYT